MKTHTIQSTKIFGKNYLSIVAALLFLLVTHYSAPSLADDTNIWIPCANEGQNCSLLQNGSPVNFAITRIGAGGQYHFIASSGLNDIPCNVDVAGDANYGAAKKCAYTQQDLIGLSTIEESAWGQTCANQGGYCENTSNNIWWMRYGIPAETNSPARWVYVPVANGKVQCSNNFVGVDPAYGRNDKSCWMLEQSTGFAENASPAVCANEPNDCTFSDLELRAAQIRPLDSASVTNGRTILVSAPNLQCDISSFKYDPASGQAKQCSSLPLRVKATNLVGRWNLIVSAQCPGGQSSCTVSESITTGTLRSDTGTNTNQESLSIQRTAEAGFTIDGASAKVSSTIAAQWVHTTSYATMLQQSMTNTRSISCNVDLASGTFAPTDSITMYQFTTSQDLSCIEDGSCSQTTNTIQVACGLNIEGQYIPKCLPGYFDKTDTTLQSCTYQ